MNMIELQDKLKNFSQEQLIQQMQAPDGSAPQFMVLSEITRRKRMQDDLMAQQAKQGGATVAEEVIAAAGVPQAGLPQMAGAMAPKSSIAQNTGIGSLPQAPQGMAGGGPVKRMAEGGKVVVIRGRRFIEQPDGSLVSEGDVRDGRSSSVAQADSVSPASRAEALNEYYPNANYVPVTQSVRPEFPGDIAVPGPSRPVVSADMIWSEPEMQPGPGVMLPPTAAAPQEVLDYLYNSETVPNTVRPEMPGSLPSAPEQPFVRSPTLEDATLYTPPSDRARRPMPVPEDSGIMDTLKSAAGSAYNIARYGNPLLDAADYVGNAALDFFNPEAEPRADRDQQGGPIDDTDDMDGLPPELAPGVDPSAPAGPQTAPYSAVAGVGGIGGTGGGGGSGGGSSGAGSSGGYMSELEAALKRAEKTAEQDKWLSLAQAGLALMASDEPTLGGAIGEAGQAGISGFRSARDTYENTRMSLMQAIQAQKAAAAKAIGGGGRGGGAPSIDSYLKSLTGDLSNIMVETEDELGNKTLVPRQGFEEVAAMLTAQEENLMRQKYGLPPIQNTFDATQ